MKTRKSAILLFLACATMPALAQDALTPLVVTARRTPDKPEEVPYSAALLSLDTLQQNQTRTLPEALENTPGVFVQKTAHGHGSPFIRGLTGRQNLLLVDGVRANNSTWRSGPIQYWNTVDSQSIDHIELIRSQGSVLYGSDAAGGTLNAFTKEPSFRSRDAGQIYQGGSAYYEYRTNGEGSHIGRLEAETGVGGKFGIMLGATIKEFGDIEDSAVGTMKGTGYPEQDFDLKAQWAVNTDSTITFAHYYVNQDDVSRWHRTLDNPGWTHGSHVTAPGEFIANDYDQERSLTYLRYEGSDPRTDAAIRRWRATLSYQTSRDSEFQNRDATDWRYSDIDLNTFGLDVQLESPVGPGSLVYGVDFYHDDVNSSGRKTDAAGSFYDETLPVADDSEYDLTGAYAEYAWNPLTPLEITAGTRFTHARAELGRYYDSTGAVQNSTSENWNSLVGSLRASWMLNPDWSLFGGISQAFRAPNLDDLSGNQSSKSGIPALGNVDLDPENFLTYEIGVRQTTETTSVQAAVFYTDISDLITGIGYDTNGDGVEDGTIATNATDAYSYGVELEGAWRFAPQWTLSGYLAWQEGRQESAELIGGPVKSQPTTRSLPLTGSLALRWTSESQRYWIESRVTAANNEDRITAADQASDDQRIPTNGTPGYGIVSLRGGWQCTDWLELTAALENITDEDYRIHGSGQNEPGFGAIIGARVMW
jgi:hemoglobin/transferrin/lactoferrin receptor protein